MIELNNCPFCGTKAVSSVFSVDVYNWYEEKVCCENCKCIISHPQAIQIWNTRPAEDAKDKEIAELKEKNRQYSEVISSMEKTIGRAEKVLGERNLLAAEVEGLKAELADRDMEGYAGFVIGVDQMKKKLAEKDKEIERLKKALHSILQNAEFWDNEDDSLAIIYRIANEVLGQDTNAPDNNVGKMEEK